MEIITPESLDKIITGAESVAKVAGGVTTELMNEAINLFIVESVLSVLKFLAIFVVFYIVKRYCDSMAEGAEDKTKKMFKAFKTAALVASILFFTGASFPHLIQISKALVAPKVFLLEKANELRK